MSSKSCPAGGDHTPVDYATELFGSFTACSKCGVRFNEMCPMTPAGHGDHKYSPTLIQSEHGVISVGKCDFCEKVVR